MIRNKLSVLLAERGIKATKVSNDTGIARSTLSKITNNSSEKIDYSTINTLCRYLKITPCDFFEYAPIDITKIFVSIDEKLISDPSIGEPNTWEIEAYINMDSLEGSQTFEYSGILEDFGKGPNENNVLGVYVEPASEEEVISVDLYLGDLSQTFITDITERFKNEIANAVTKFGMQGDDDFIKINLLDRRKKA